MNNIGRYSHIIDAVCNGDKSRLLVRKMIPILADWAKRHLPQSLQLQGELLLIQLAHM